MPIVKKLASKIFRIGTLVIASVILMTAFSVGLLRFFNPPFTSFMIWESNFFEKEVNYNWTPIRDMGKILSSQWWLPKTRNFVTI